MQEQGIGTTPRKLTWAVAVQLLLLVLLLCRLQWLVLLGPKLAPLCRAARLDSLCCRCWRLLLLLLPRSCLR